MFEYLKRQKKHREEILLEKFRTEQLILQTQIEVQEQTRKNLAADLHDNIGQLLSLTNVTLASINTNDKEKAEQKIADTRELVTRSIRELRQLSKIIHGEQLIQQGLLKTIEQEITWLERNGHYSVEFVHHLPDIAVNTADKDLFAYRLLQESINNIIKHSGANRIRIELVYKEPLLHLTVTDNGIGFNADEKPAQQGGLGLLNMQKRVGLLNGSMQVHSEENKGTTITFSIPYP
ncbi:MAG TPA: sensor histidine kinase [Prolixibacteraceae bacterium]